MKEFKGKLDKGPMRRSPTLAMVGGRCIYDQHHGGGGELFSSEVNSSLKEVERKEAQCVRRLELQKGLIPCWNVAWSREELVEACAAGPTTCMGVAAGVAYSS